MRQALFAAIFILCSLSALAAGEDVIYSGIDLLWTPNDGRSYTNFAIQPIPAGFFCEGSAPFKGRIFFKGEPLASVPANALKGADTVIHRLDDAVFDEDGLAYTRIQFKAISLVSSAPVRTECGLFDVRVSLGSEQPMSGMRIQRTGPDSGRYLTNLGATVKLIFTPSNGKPTKRAKSLSGQPREGLELIHTFRFSPNPDAVWARLPGGTDQPMIESYALVDVDGDGDAETPVPSRSNFLPGHVFVNGSLTKIANTSLAGAQSALCHCDDSLSFESPQLEIDPEPYICLHLHCNSN